MPSIFPTFLILATENNGDMICDISPEDFEITCRALPGMIVCRGEIVDTINGNTVPTHIEGGFTRGDFISYDYEQGTIKTGRGPRQAKIFAEMDVGDKNPNITQNQTSKFIGSQLKLYGYTKRSAANNTAVMVTKYDGDQYPRLFLNDVHSLSNNESVQITVSSNTYLYTLTESVTINSTLYPESSWIHIENEQTLDFEANNEVLIGEFI